MGQMAIHRGKSISGGKRWEMWGEGVGKASLKGKGGKCGGKRWDWVENRGITKYTKIEDWKRNNSDI